MSERLSKSKIKDYLQCPRKFRYRYVDKKETPPNKFFKIGSDVHQIAEDFIKRWSQDKTIDIPSSLLELEESYGADYRDHCMNLASFFNQKLISEGYEIFSAEEYLLSEKYNFSGLADIVLEHDGELTVIDYKTGKSRNVKNYSTELCYYKMLIEDKYPEKTVRYAGIFFTKDGRYNQMKFTDEDCSDVSCSKREYLEKLDLMEDVRKKIDTKQFAPKRQFLCKYCDFKKYCDAEGFITLDSF